MTTPAVETLHPAFRSKVELLLQRVAQRTDSRGKPWQPRLYYGWRSPAVQADLYKRGKSDVQYSYHNVTDPDGTPQALAADIIDRRYAWDLGPKESSWTTAQRKAFWQALGEEAEALGLVWGGRWVNLYDPAHVQTHKVGDQALQQLAQGAWPPPGLPVSDRVLNRGGVLV